MFEIILTACLATTDICAERMIPARYPDLAACKVDMPKRTAKWTAAHEGLTVSSPACIASDELADHVAPLAVTQVASGVFVHKPPHGIPNPDNAGDLANLGFVIGEKSVAVIDAGGSRHVAERLYSAIRARTDLPISAMILTHVHPDHSLGASLFQEAGATVIGHPNLELSLANRAESYSSAMQRLMGPKAYLGTRIVGPDETSVLTVDLGERALTISYISEIAHSDTDLTVMDQQTGILFAGDLVFAGHTPALDGSILGWQRVLDEMTRRTFTRVVPGHGPPALAWPGGADAMRAYLSAITEETRAAIANGEPMSRAVRHIGEQERSNWELFDEFNQRNATTAYKELEWE
ncbi:MAG: quinoprotein relay system zinc metallohydrolase 2 [Pseudomonadota bacterium]